VSGRREVRDVEIVGIEPARRPFLAIDRLAVRNHYADGRRSETYPCDVVSRRGVDAVTVIVWQRGDDGRVRVGLRENLRPAVWLRRARSAIPFPDDEPEPATVIETAAGIIEDEDAALPLPAALRIRAAAECREELGLDVDPAAIEPLGGAAYPSPGITDEKVFFVAAEADLDAAAAPTGDGSVMEEAGGLVVLDLDEAIARCRDGVTDMKTEIALVRLRERLRRAGGASLGPH